MSYGLWPTTFVEFRGSKNTSPPPPSIGPCPLIEQFQSLPNNKRISGCCTGRSLACSFIVLVRGVRGVQASRFSTKGRFQPSCLGCRQPGSMPVRPLNGPVKKSTRCWLRTKDWSTKRKQRNRMRLSACPRLLWLWYVSLRRPCSLACR